MKSIRVVLPFLIFLPACMAVRNENIDKRVTNNQPDDSQISLGLAGIPELAIFQTKKVGNSTQLSGIASPAVDTIKTKICQKESCQEVVHYKETFILTVPKKGTYDFIVEACSLTVCKVVQKWSDTFAHDLSADKVKILRTIEAAKLAIGSNAKAIQDYMRKNLEAVSDDSVRSQLKDLSSLEANKFAVILGNDNFLDNYLTSLSPPATETEETRLAFALNAQKNGDILVIAEVTSVQPDKELIIIESELSDITAAQTKINEKILAVVEEIQVTAAEIVNGEIALEESKLIPEQLEGYIDQQKADLLKLDKHIIVLEGKISELKASQFRLQERYELTAKDSALLDEVEEFLKSDSPLIRRLQGWGVLDKKRALTRRAIKVDYNVKTSPEALEAIKEKNAKILADYAAIKAKTALNQENLSKLEVKLSKAKEMSVRTSSELLLLQTSTKVDDYKQFIADDHEILSSLQRQRASLISQKTYLEDTKSWLEGGKVGSRPELIPLEVQVKPKMISLPEPSGSFFARLMKGKLRLAGDAFDIKAQLAKIQEQTLDVRLWEMHLMIDAKQPSG